MNIAGMEYEWTDHAISRFRERIGGNRAEALARCRRSGKGLKKKIRKLCSFHGVLPYPYFYQVRYDPNGKHDVYVTKVEGRGKAKVITCWRCGEDAE